MVRWDWRHRMLVADGGGFSIKVFGFVSRGPLLLHAAVENEVSFHLAR